MVYANTPPHYHSIAERRAQSTDDAQIKKLHAALAPYIDLAKLRDLAAQSEDLDAALRCDNPPEEVLDLVRLLAAILRPKHRERIRSPADAAALLMVEMGHLDQEELRTVLLNTKNHVVGIVTIYRGSIDRSLVRVSEIYKPALRRNSAAIIVVHNHPSGEPDPSPVIWRIFLQSLDVTLLEDHTLIPQVCCGILRYATTDMRGHHKARLHLQYAQTLSGSRASASVQKPHTRRKSEQPADDT